jgi:hypothetical protein
MVLFDSRINGITRIIKFARAPAGLRLSTRSGLRPGNKYRGIKKKHFPSFIYGRKVKFLKTRPVNSFKAYMPDP